MHSSTMLCNWTTAIVLLCMAVSKSNHWPKHVINRFELGIKDQEDWLICLWCQAAFWLNWSHLYSSYGNCSGREEPTDKLNLLSLGQGLGAGPPGGELDSRCVLHSLQRWTVSKAFTMELIMNSHNPSPGVEGKCVCVCVCVCVFRHATGFIFSRITYRWRFKCNQELWKKQVWFLMTLK